MAENRILKIQVEIKIHKHKLLPCQKLNNKDDMFSKLKNLSDYADLFAIANVYIQLEYF